MEEQPKELTSIEMMARMLYSKEIIIQNMGAEINRLNKLLSEKEIKK